MTKKAFTYTALFLCSICSIMEGYTQTNASRADFRIVGQISGRDTGTVILMYMNAANEYRHDTTVLDHGRFNFSGSVRHATEALIWTNLQNRDFDDQSVIRFILEPGLINISKVDGEKATISGSPSQAEKEKWDSVKDQIKSQYRQADSIWTVLVKMDVEYAAKHPETYLGGYLLRRRCRLLSVDSVMLLYSALADSVRNSSIGYEVLSYVYPLTDDHAFRMKYPLIDTAFSKRLAGIRSIQDFRLRDISGKLVDLSRFRGKYLLVDVWASWCKPCIANIPVWNNLIKQYDPDDIQFIAVSFDTDVDAWKQAIRKHKPGGIQLIDPTEFKGLFAVYCKVLWPPTYLIVDPAGRIVNYNAAQEGEQEWRKLLDSYVDHLL